MGFRIGDIVRRLDGDGRPHKIVDVEVCFPLNRNEHTFFVYHYEDGGSDVSDYSNLAYYDGKYKKFEL
jgi:hypothetical protein